MRRLKASKLARQFIDRVAEFDATRGRLESALLAGELTLGDVESAYAGLFLQVVVAYEATIEDFMLGIIVRPGGVSSARQDVKARLWAADVEHARELVAGYGREYIDWLGSENLEKIAKLFLVDGIPIKPALGDPPISWNYVKQSVYIRNAIAHPSQSAQKKFERHVINNTPVPARERKVAAYLRGRTGASGTTRWEFYALALRQIVVTVVA